MPDWISNLFGQPWMDAALRILLIAVLAVAAEWSVGVSANRLLGRVAARTKDLDRRERLTTLIQVGRGTAYILILVAAAMMILQALDINIAPLLAGAGVAGLALSLGAQTLIKDYLGGALILLENQYAVGDVVEAGGVSGAVERITLRATYLRDLEGRLRIVPNGEVRVVSNLTHEWARAVVTLNVDLQSDVAAAMRALETAAEQAAADPALQDRLQEPPQAMGWVGMTDWAVQLRLLSKTLPGEQWQVGMALRQHALDALRAAGVRLALPAQTIKLENTD